MKSVPYKGSVLIYALICLQLFCLTSCNSKSSNSDQIGEIGFLEFYLDMENLKVKSIRDSLLNLGVLEYVETTDELGNKHKDLYYDFSGTGPSLYAKINLKGSYIIDERLTNIQFTLCSKLDSGEQSFSYKCDLDETKKLFELYREKYGEATRLDREKNMNGCQKEFPMYTYRVIKEDCYWMKYISGRRATI